MYTYHMHHLLLKLALAEWIQIDALSDEAALSPYH